MLQQLLDELRRGGTQDPKALATRLHTTPQMIEALLEHLQRAGVLRAYTGCADGCGSCSLRPDCTTKAHPTPRLWTLVE